MTIQPPVTPPAPISSPVARRDSGGVAFLTLAQPHKRNALSEAMLEALHLALEDIAGNAHVRAVVLDAAGPVFCAGHDLKEMTAHRADADEGRAYFAMMMDRCAAMMQAIVQLPVPVIAAVEGVATAAGCQLVASCDLAIAGAHAKFCTPGVNIGLFCSTPMVALSRNLTRKHAMEMLLTGDMVDAATAVRFGLVNRAVGAGDAVSRATEMAAMIATKARPTIVTGKRAFYEQAEMGLADAYRHCAGVMVENMLAADAEEGICAFIEKRAPSWPSA
ncbi:MAG: enoyl-CoA hydratase [Beijerinckiaceae bacterium]